MTETTQHEPESAAEAAAALRDFPMDRDEILTLAELSEGIGLWHLDLANLMLSGTPQFFRMMGLPPASHPVPLEVTKALRHPEDRDRVQETYRHAMDSVVGRCEVTFRIVRPSGEIRWIHGRGRVIRDATGRPVRFTGVNVDVTESKRSEAALRESEVRFRRVFEQSPLGKVTVGIDYRLREVNPALCSMLGHSAEDLIGRSILDVVHPDDRALCTAAGEALRRGAVPQAQFEARYVRSSGESLWVNVTVAPIRSPDGDTLHFLGIIEDFDERKRMTQALQDSERRLRELNEQLGQAAEERARELASSQAQLQAFFDNSPDWLTLVRASPDGRFTFVDVNPTTEVAYGRPRAQIVEHPVEEVLGADQAQVPLHYFRECVRTGTTQRYQAHRTLAGRTTTIDVMFVPVPPHDDSPDRYIITTARDLTEHEQLEAQLRQAQKMEAIGKLTGGVAHDFNNLLAVITGNAELARRRPESQTPRRMDNILRASERGVALTRQLLSFSRRQSTNPQIIDLRTEVPRVAEMLRVSLRAGVRLAVTVGDDVWPIEADLAEFEIALLNLAANARDAMPQGGIFAIDVRNANPPGRSATPEAEHVTITVDDTGTGIPPEVLGKVFDPFFTTKQPGEGTGLGLSQVYGFARQSGGEASIDSAPGRGTTVTLRLPRARRSVAPADAEAVSPTTAQRHERILLVEDNPEVALVTAQMLRSMGFAVEVANRARKALARLDAGQRFDLLLSDVVMPDGVTGLDLARAVRQRYPALPIILMSGYNDVVTGGETGFQVLRKPVPFKELFRSVSAGLDRVAAREPVESGA